MRYLLDTNMASAAMRGVAVVDARLRALQPSDWCISAVTRAELQFGVALRPGATKVARIVEAFLTKKGNTAPWAIIAVLKLFFLLGGVWLILKSGVVSGLALVIGYMALPTGAVIASLFGPKPPEDTG